MQNLIHNPTPSPQILRNLKWAACTAAFALVACGGGGGSDGSAPAPPAGTPPAPPAPPAVLNAQEELAYQSWALRQVTLRYVEERDEIALSGPLSAGGRLNFVGKYPANGCTGTGQINNLPVLAASATGVCKDGGTNKQVDSLINNNTTYEAGESTIVTYTGCTDASLILSGTDKLSFTGSQLFYPAPNNKAIKSVQLDETTDYTYTTPSLGYSTTLKGTLGIDITDPRRVYALKDVAYTFNQGSIVANMTIIINRATSFGNDQPFTVQSMAGSTTIDGKSYTVTSTNGIPMRSVVAYLPRSGSITATASNGDKIITDFTPTGAQCSLVPYGTTTASVTVAQCSQML